MNAHRERTVGTMTWLAGGSMVIGGMIAQASAWESIEDIGLRVIFLCGLFTTVAGFLLLVWKITRFLGKTVDQLQALNRVQSDIDCLRDSYSAIMQQIAAQRTDVRDSTVKIVDEVKGAVKEIKNGHGKEEPPDASSPRS